MATYSDLQQDVFYRGLNLAQTFKQEACEHFSTHTRGKGLSLATRLYMPGTHTALHLRAPCPSVLGLSVWKQLKDPGVEEAPGWSELKSWGCLGPWLVLDAMEEGA